MTQPTALKCPCCDAPLTAPEGRGQFFCQFCGTPVTIPGSPETADSTTAGPKPAVVIPEKLHIEEYGGELRITWKWINWAVLFFVPFCIAWNTFVVGWYSMAFSDDGPPFGMKIIMVLFPIGHLVIGLGLLYGCLVMLLNRTTIRVAFGELSIRHGPIPVPGNRAVPADDIEQLYVRHERKSNSDGNASHAYPLLARLKSGQEVKLLPRNSELEVARAIEQLVEKHLGIRDEPVPGEVRV